MGADLQKSRRKIVLESVLTDVLKPTDNDPNDPVVRLELVGCVVHHGEQIRAGHFSAWIVAGRSNVRVTDWQCFDDSSKIVCGAMYKDDYLQNTARTGPYKDADFAVYKICKDEEPALRGGGSNGGSDGNGDGNGRDSSSDGDGSSGSSA